MNMLLAAGGVVALIVGLVHSVRGEVLIFRRFGAGSHGAKCQRAAGKAGEHPVGTLAYRNGVRLGDCGPVILVCDERG